MLHVCQWVGLVSCCPLLTLTAHSKIMIFNYDNWHWLFCNYGCCFNTLLVHSKLVCRLIHLNIYIWIFCKICTTNTLISMNKMSRPKLLKWFHIQIMGRIENKTKYLRLIDRYTHIYIIYIYRYISYFAIGAKVSIITGRGRTYLQPPLFAVGQCSFWTL